MLQQNDILGGMYQILEPIGKGGIGVVYLAWHLRLNKYVVVKQIYNTNIPAEHVRQETDVLKQLHHTYLPQVYDHFQTGDGIFTVIDYVCGNSLESYLGTWVEERDVLRWLMQLTQVLTYLHSQDPPILHCDIKAANILINEENDAVLIDFNTALQGYYTKLTGLSVNYAAPEQFALAQYMSAGISPDFAVDARADIYSMAATFYELLCGHAPTSYQQNPPLAAMNLPYSVSLLQILDKCMSQNREDRPPSAQALGKQLERLRRRDRQYRQYWLAQVGSLVLSVGLLAGGLSCLVASQTQRKVEAFNRAYLQVVAYREDSDTALAESACLELLNDDRFHSYLTRNPDKRAGLLYILGDTYYDWENYDLAADYFADAAAYARQGKDADLQELAARDQILSLAQAGKLEKAQALLEEAPTLTDHDLLLVKAVIASRQGDRAGCVETVRQLLASRPDAEIAGQACMAAAQVDDEVYWLEQGCQYTRTKPMLRRLALAYAQAGARDPAMLEKARKIYTELTDSPYATVEDWTNCAVIYRMQGQPRYAAELLMALPERFPEDYRISMGIAFAWNEAGEIQKSLHWCRQALQQWEDCRASYKEPRSSNNIQNLLALAQMYGG